MIIVENNNIHYGFNKNMGDNLTFIPFLNVESALSASKTIVKERGEGVYQGEVVDIQKSTANVSHIPYFLDKLIGGRPFEFKDSEYSGVIIIDSEFSYIIEYTDRYEAAFVRADIEKRGLEQGKLG